MNVDNKLQWFVFGRERKWPSRLRLTSGLSPQRLRSSEPASSVMDVLCFLSISDLLSERVYVCDLWKPFHHPRLARCHPIPDPRCPCPSFQSQGLRFKQRLVFTSLLLWFMSPFHSYRPGKFLLLSFHYFSTKIFFRY